MAKCKPILLADGGVENFTGAVDELVETGLLNRVLAQTEITFSNSMIESWWRVLKHQWLFLNTLDSVKTVETLVGFYVKEHNFFCHTQRFAGKRQMKCTSVKEATFLTNLRPRGRRHARNGSRPIGSERVAHVRGRSRSQAESECPVSGG
ncbi:hypothetical protein N9B98_00395 [bacterium]|nr:hypothetical protein [bacterium]